MSASSWLARILSADALATLRILPRNGRIAWVSRSRACLAEPPALSPSTRKISVPAALSRVQSASLPGSRNLRVAVLRAISRCWRRRWRSSARSAMRSSSSRRSPGRRRANGRNGRCTAPSTSRVASAEASRSLVWPWNCGSRMNSDSSIAAPDGDVLAGRLGDAAVADQLAIGLDAAQQRVAQPGLVGPALRGRDRVAIGVAEAVLLVLGPGHRPFDAAAFAELDLAEKRPRRQESRSRRGSPPENRRARPENAAAPPAGTPSGRGSDGVAAPADLDAAEQIGLGARHPVEQSPGGTRPRRRSRDRDESASVVPRRFCTGPAILDRLPAARRGCIAAATAAGRARPRPRARRTAR